jgi:hypothetical protein
MAYGAPEPPLVAVPHPELEFPAILMTPVMPPKRTSEASQLNNVRRILRGKAVVIANGFVGSQWGTWTKNAHPVDLTSPEVVA